MAGTSTKNSRTGGRKASSQSSGKASGSSSRGKTSTAKGSRSRSTSQGTRKASASRQRGGRRKKQQSAVRRDVTLIVLFALTIFLFLCNFMSMGIVGEFFSGLMFGLTGFLAYFLPVVVFALYLYYILMEDDPKIISKIIALAGLLVIFSVFLEMGSTDLSLAEGFDPVGIYERCAQNRSGGGLIGGAIAFVLYSLLKTVGMVIALVVLAIVCLYVLAQRSFLELFRDKAKDVQAARRERRQEEERYRREHPEEFEEDSEEEPEEEFREEEENYSGRRTAGEKRRENVRHFRGIVGSTDLSEYETVPQQVPDFPENSPAQNYSQAASAHSAATSERSDDAPDGGSSIPDIAAAPGLRFSGQEPDLTESGAEEEPPAKPRRAGLLYTAELHEIYPGEEPPAFKEGVITSQESPALTKEIFPGEEPSAVQEEVFSGEEPPASAKEIYSGEESPVLAQEASFGEESPAAREEMCPEKELQAPGEEIFSGEDPSQISIHMQREVPAADADGSPEESLCEPAPTGEDQKAGELSAAKPGDGAEDALPEKPREYVFPPIGLLRPGKGASSDSEEELRRTAAVLTSTLSSFGVRVRITDISQGPSVTRYEMLPETGVKVSRIVSLSDDIKLALAATDIRIEAPIPGKSAIGIEVPNRESQPVMLRDIVDCPEFRNQKSRLAFAVGKDIAGRPVYSDIAKMPHVLIAGATGSGKSVCINTIIMSILYHARPDEVKFIMVDPKVVELSVYNGIPHLLIPVVTNPQKATAALNWAVSEMEARYRAFADARVRDISSYNALVREKEAAGGLPEDMHFMPQIVVIVDELADLMMVAKNDVETAICRLAQLARAAGIHLIIATQRPSVDVITGLIKANMPSRIAFRVSSGVDSRTILDMVGAEKLLGRGDMLFFPQGLPKPTRVQGCFVSDEEVNEVASFLIRSSGVSDEEQQRHQEEIDAIEAQGSMESSAGAAGGSTASPEPSVDELFGSAGAFIIEKNNASIGLLQRRYRIGFNRAARIMDQLCLAGVVSESEGTKPRTVLMTPAEFAAYCADNGIRIPEQV